MSSVAITVDGVLRKVVGLQPIDIGLKLYHSLADQFHVVLISDSQLPDLELTQFLDSNQLFEHVKVIGTDVVTVTLPEALRRVEQVNQARADGQNIQLVVEPNPTASAELISHGYTVATFTPAEYSVPSWRPDYVAEPMPWDALSKQVADQARLKAEDTRVKLKDSVGNK